LSTSGEENETMATLAPPNAPAALATIWTGRVLTGLFALFMLSASIAPKLLGMPVAADTLVELGWPGSYALMIGVLELVFLALYLVPRTSVLGAVLMTALLGGAMAAHLRVGSPPLSHTFFGVYLALFMWGGLWLRNSALRSVFPFETRKD
jgi:hypothetical protein